MSLQSFSRVLACSFALCCHVAVMAQNVPVPRYEEEVKPDADLPFPAPPNKANLLRFPTDWTSNEIYIDSASLVLANGVASFTLVVRGAGGADNVTFESLSCLGQRRVLAYGKRDGSWSPARSSDWLPVRDARNNRYYFELWKDVFCQGDAVQSRRNVIQDIKRGGRVSDYTSPGE